MDQDALAFPNLENHRYMSLVTYRKNGEPVPTPVWFAQVNDKLYVYSEGKAHKLNRLRNNPQVTVAPCTINGEVLGEAQTATARFLDETEAKKAITALNKKYGLQKIGLDILGRITGSYKKRVYLEISAA